MFVCVSILSPAWLPWSAFADLGQKVLVRYGYHSYGTHFLCLRLTFGKTAKALPTRREVWRGVLRAYNTPILLEANS